MPNRILHESICYSADIAALGWFTEAFWYRLLTQCDDYGRTDGRVEVVRARCFQVQLEDVTVARVSLALVDLARRGMVQLYESGGRPYIQIVNWERRQNVRAKRSRYPEPPDSPSLLEGFSTDSPQSEPRNNGQQVTADASNGQHMSPESESESESVSVSESNSKDKGAAAPSKSPSELQAGLLTRLHEISGWDSVTFGAVVALNGVYTRPIVTMALQRAREENQAPNGSAYGLLDAMCQDITAKQEASA